MEQITILISFQICQLKGLLVQYSVPNQLIDMHISSLLIKNNAKKFGSNIKKVVLKPKKTIDLRNGFTDDHINELSKHGVSERYMINKKKKKKSRRNVGCF